MKKEEFEKCISDLSPELQEKARTELSDDALEAVAGGCFTRSTAYHTVCGEALSSWGFPEKTYYCNRCRKTVTDEEIEFR